MHSPKAQVAVWLLAALLLVRHCLAYADPLDVLSPDANVGTNPRPVIGVFTQPSGAYPGLNNVEYLAASYVKFAESAGARVVPIRYTSSLAELKALFQGLNGILYPGGGASLDPASSAYYRAAAYMMDLAEASNARGKRFPVWGTCLGWEFLAVWAAGSNYSVLQASGTFHDAGVVAPVTLTAAALRSTLLGRSAVRSAISQRSSFFNHEMGVDPSLFAANAKLRDTFVVLGLARDVNGKAFVAVVEGRNRPYFGLQFHPEKAVYEWSSTLAISHSRQSVLVASSFAGIFGDEVRKSRLAQFPGGDAEAFARSVHSNKQTYKYVGDSAFQEMYVWT
jgi:gamma-glutamyl hydrolase